MDQQPEGQHPEKLSSDIKAFCTLVARIILRCLRERDERALQILGLSQERPPKGLHDDSSI